MGDLNVGVHHTPSPPPALPLKGSECAYATKLALMGSPGALNSVAVGTLVASLLAPG